MNLPVPTPLLVTALPPYSQDLFNPHPFTNQHKSSGVVSMCKIHVLDEPFFCLATVAMIAENVTFSSFHCNYFKDTLFAYQVILKFQCEFFRRLIVQETLALLKNEKRQLKCESIRSIFDISLQGF